MFNVGDRVKFVAEGFFNGQAGEVVKIHDDGVLEVYLDSDRLSIDYDGTNLYCNELELAYPWE